MFSRARKQGREENEKGSNWNCARMEHITVVSFMSFEFEKRSRIKHDNRPFRGPFGRQAKARLLCKVRTISSRWLIFFFFHDWKIIWETLSQITELFHSFNLSKCTIFLHHAIYYHYYCTDINCMNIEIFEYFFFFFFKPRETMNIHDRLIA